jgi:hypothetical protein
LKPQSKTVLTIALGLIWAGAAIVGGRILLNYENYPGKIGQVSSSWPADSIIKLADDRPTLVMFAHPQCPCTRASMDEFAQVMAHVQGKVRAYVLFYTPQQAGSDWQNTDLRRSAAQIPGVSALSDIDGVEAERFGAETSGHTFLFDRGGRLLFNGGVTGSRGHSGDNAGESALVSLINNHKSDRAETFVFGCGLKAAAQKEAGPKCLR